MSDNHSSKTSPRIRRRRPKKGRRASELITALSFPGPTTRPATAPPLPFIIADNGKIDDVVITKSGDEAQSADIMILDAVPISSSTYAGVEGFYKEPTNPIVAKSTVALTTSNNCSPENASFMGLPGEVRQMIFAYILSPYNPKGYSSMIYGHEGKNPRVLGRGHGQICRLNRQCYNESIDLLYAQTLVFLNHETMTEFFKQRTLKQLSQLRSLHMLVRCTDWIPAIRALELPHETSLKVDWPITKDLWIAMGENKTLSYRKVQVKNERGQKWVLFESKSTPPKPYSKSVLLSYYKLLKRFRLDS